MKKKEPVQQSLFAREEYIAEHQEALEELQAQPTILPTTQTIMDISLHKNMKQYHKVAIEMLESGIDPSTTIDALSGDELLEYMQQQGFFVHFTEE